MENQQFSALRRPRRRTTLAGCIVAGIALLAVPSLAQVTTPATAPAADLDAATDPFPLYESIRGHVTFWERVWAEWRTNQIAVHHRDHPSIVYQIVHLPGPESGSYTEHQLDFMRAVRERWQDKLEDLADRAAAGQPLSDDEKRLVLEITETAGSDGLRDAHKFVRNQRGLRERFLRGLEISARYDAIFRSIFRESGLPEDLAFLPHVESSFQAAARSHAGAVGIWQFTRGTGRRYMAITSAVDERLDPIAAARGAAAYLRDAHAELGDWPIALTSYNHGVGGMLRAVKRHGTDYEAIFAEYDGRSFGFASKNFYAEFLAARRIAKNPEKYFPEGVNFEPPHDLDDFILETRTTPAAIARGYSLPVDDLARLNPGWSRRAVSHGLTLPRSIRVWLPPGTRAAYADGGLPIFEDMTQAGVYTVNRGDTLGRIAQNFGMSLPELLELNGMPRDQQMIRVGQKLNVAGDGAVSTYVVRRGDTLGSIARSFGMRTNTLRDLNGISRNSSLILVGQRLSVHGGDAERFHVVRSGDTLSRIAVLYGVRLNDLLRANSLGTSSLIRPGQKIQIPS